MSMNLKTSIKNRLKGKVAIVGIGNILHGDDGLGSKIIELLKSKPVKADLFDCGTAPESCIFRILSASCDTVILVDAADLGIGAGGIKIFDSSEISNVSFSAHSPSPRLFADLLRTGRDNLNIFIVSVQPKCAAMGAGLTEEVLAGLDLLTEAFSEALT